MSARLPDDWLWKQHQRYCIHFTALRDAECRAGVRYDDVKDTSQRPYTWPCMTTDYRGVPYQCAKTCDKRAFLTDEQAKAELEEQRAATRAWLADLNANICPTHKIPITQHQVGRCVYAEPCGCRLYQGTLKKVPS